MSRLKIKDGEGKLPVDLMRIQFEALVRETEKLKRSFPLGIMEINGEFSHYTDSSTDELWLGFALGMRVCHRHHAQDDQGADGHIWWVYSTALAQGWLMLRCAVTGKTATVRDPSRAEWGAAYYSPSFPFRWHNHERVVVDAE